MFFNSIRWGQLKRCILIITGLSLLACQSGEGKDKLSKGVDKTMKTYPMGRYSINVPVSMKQEIQEHRIRSCDVKEFVWPTDKNKDQVREEIFNARIAEINMLKRPKNVTKIIMENRIIRETGQWARGVFYYGDSTGNDEGFWDVLVDAGPVGVWIKFNGELEGKEEMYNWVVDIAKSYNAYESKRLTQFAQGNIFHLQYGVLNLPYLEQEHTYARFKGHPLDLMLQIRMNETHEVEKASLVENIGKFIISNATPGLDIKKIRATKRTVAGLKGEELVLKMTETGESELKFRWQYQGKEDSGEYPEIDITMESPDGNIDEKLKIWDSILNSMKPMFERKK